MDPHIRLTLSDTRAAMRVAAYAKQSYPNGSDNFVDCVKKLHTETLEMAVHFAERKLDDLRAELDDLHTS